MRLTELEFCELSYTYGRLEILFYLISIVAGHRLSYGKGLGQPVLYIVERV